MTPASSPSPGISAQVASQIFAGGAALAAIAAPALSLYGLDPGPLALGPLAGLLLAALLASAGFREHWLGAFLALNASTRWLLGLVPAIGVATALIAGGPLADRLVYVASLAASIGIAIAMPAALQAIMRVRDHALLAVPALAVGVFVMLAMFRYTALDAPANVDALLGDHEFGFALWLCWAVPFAAALPPVLPARRLRYLPHLVTSTLWTLALAAGASAALVAIAIGHLVAALTVPVTGRRALRLQALAALIGYAFYRGGYEFLASARDASPLVAGDWHDALRTIGHNFLAGAGPGHYSLAPAANAPGSALLQFAAEWGLPATIALLVVAAVGLRAWFARPPRHARRPRDARGLVVAAATAASVSTLIGISLTGRLDLALPQLYNALGVGMMMSLYGLGAATPTRQPLGRHIALTVVAMLVVLVFVNALQR